MPIRRLDKTLTATTATVAGEDIAASAIPVKPHIQPGVLQPAIAGKLLDGTTSHGATYGVAQSDGHSYYYTDIKGSKPIKDPRIGAHFGSQRHKFKSLQKLEQETATHGEDVYSIDGREWIRRVGAFSVHDANGANGVFTGHTATGDATNSKYFEIVGYFNAVNYMSYAATVRDVNVFIDGTQNPSSTITSGTAAVDTPLSNRYVDASSVINIPITGLTTPGIHTLKIANVNGDYLLLFGIELIAQDTSSTANKSKIQIPAQNVVSYGKKFAIPATAQHYDPFNGFTNGTTLHSAVVDTATSLGLDTAPGASAKWAISNTNNIRPYNGGRVVKWIASDGTIKTSVNMMPPNAQNGDTAASNEITTPSATNTTTTPNMSNDAVDQSLAEVAKSFHWREFGNGSANGNANYADASTLTTSADDIAYVMDDGLTSFMADDARVWPNEHGGVSVGGGKTVHFTFIGTGLSLIQTPHIGTLANGVDDGTCVQNLPYGTHIMKYTRTDGAADTIDIDGIRVYGDTSTNGWIGSKFFNIHQPKMPPIPDDACIIADYMLMADFVGFSNGTAGDKAKISKGVRRISASRDHFYNSGATLTFGIDMSSVELPADGFRVYNNHASTVFQLPYFGTSPVFRSGVGSDRSAAAQFKINGTLVTTSSSGTNHSGTQVLNSWTTGSGSFQTDNDGSFTMNGSTAMGWASVSGITLGQNTVAVNNTTTTYLTFNGYDVATPIHTSSHYQPFETLYNHELVGGDRNMEQNNLVVTHDGKTWDEVTRDTSYIGNTVMKAKRDGGHVDNSAWIWDIFRGVDSESDMVQKNIAIAYDRLIFLEDGEYDVSGWTYNNNAAAQWYVCKNNISAQSTESLLYQRHNDSDEPKPWRIVVHMDRGDYLHFRAGSASANSIHGSNPTLNDLTIRKV
jgi:hypothetical protein